MIFKREGKHIIKTGEIFAGLDVPNPDFLRSEYLKPQYIVIGGYDLSGVNVGYSVCEVIGREVLFHLVNFKPVKGGVIRPLFEYIKQFKHYTAFNASIERPAMARQLEKLGFKNVFGGLYRAEVA